MTADEFSARLSRDCMLFPGSHVLVALSGGADSTALLCLFLEIADRYPLRISCAHVEHGIRGEDSLADSEFVHALCEEKRVPLFQTHVDAPGYACAHGCGLEDAARVLRYGFLHKTAEAVGADVIALAHHAGDQAETVLLHAMRGSDLRGLCAMRVRSGRLIRPLLDEAPQALREYLISIGQSWREDESNADTKYLRNKVRHEILPGMEAAVPGAGAALRRLARAAQRDEDYFAAQLDAMNIRIYPLVDGLAVRRDDVQGLHPAQLSRLLVRLIAKAGLESQSAGVIEAIMAALEGTEDTVNLSGGAHAALGERYLCLVRADAPERETALHVPGTTETPYGRFEIYPAVAGETGDGKYAQRIPLRLLQGAYVSSRRDGDAMIPFGRKTPAKIKKLMIDAGVERAMRRSMPIVRDCAGNVLFAVGLRSGECCRGSDEDMQMMVRFCGEWPCADVD